MASGYADLLQNIHPQGPYSVLGWSFGGIVAHEVAIALGERGHSVHHLVVLDAYIDPEREQPQIEDDLAEHDVLSDYLRSRGIDVLTLREPLTYRKTKELAEQRGLTGLIPSEKFFTMIAENSRFNNRLLANHTPGIFEGDIDVIVAEQSRSDARDAGGWQQHATGSVRKYSIDCGHFAMLQPQSLRLYGDHLNTLLST